MRRNEEREAQAEEPGGFRPMGCANGRRAKKEGPKSQPDLPPPVRHDAKDEPGGGRRLDDGVAGPRMDRKSAAVYHGTVIYQLKDRPIVLRSVARADTVPRLQEHCGDPLGVIRSVACDHLGNR